MERLGTKKTFLIFLGALVLALISIFIVFCFYRISINPNPQVKDSVEVSSEEEEVNDEYHLHINDYDSSNNESLNPQSVFDTDLKLQEAMSNSDKNLVFKGTLEFTPELQEEYKEEIIFALYTKNYKKAIDYAKEVINNYNLNSNEFKSYEIFLYEVLELEDFTALGYQDKVSLIEGMVSPELILFLFLNLDGLEQYKILTNKDSDVVFGNAVSGVNLRYDGHLKAGIYTEMRLDSVYFVVPDNIQGFKINFRLENENYKLFYIRYEDTNKIELIGVENLTNTESVSYKTYYSMYND